MGGNQSRGCPKPIRNPDLLNVVTLSDSAVQRLPLDVEEDNPLDKEQRNQNVDDYWRERLECLDNTYSEANRISEREFTRLETQIRKMAIGQGKLPCPRNVEETTTCYLVYPNEPLRCNEYVQKLQLCMDTLMSESAVRKQKEDARKSKKVCL